VNQNTIDQLTQYGWEPLEESRGSADGDLSLLMLKDPVRQHPEGQELENVVLNLVSEEEIRVKYEQMLAELGLSIDEA